MTQEKKPKGNTWHQEFTFLLLLERCRNPALTFSERYFAILQAVKNAGLLGFRSGFRQVGAKKIAYVELPTGDEVSWTVDGGNDRLEPAPDQAKAIQGYSRAVHQRAKK
jgi:hypothetical protein